jgi:hypothetical protein
MILTSQIRMRHELRVQRDIEHMREYSQVQAVQRKYRQELYSCNITGPAQAADCALRSIFFANVPITVYSLQWSYLSDETDVMCARDSP